jgi:hypothetical protein
MPKIGVYRSATPDIAPIQAYETFLNKPVDCVLSFMADSPTWAQFEQAVLQSVTNGPPGSHSAMEWAPLLGSRQLVLGVPACVQGSTWATEASGANDAHWAALAQNLVSAGLGGSILRIAREFQGGWPWKVTAATIAAHQAGWAHIVGVMRGAGFTGLFMWNPYIGTFTPASEVVSAYPGDATVDIIGLDLYDGGYTPAGEIIRTAAQQQAVWDNFRDQWDGLTGWRNWAASHKPLAYPEWGLGLWNAGNLYGGGGDNALFVSEMAAWIKDTQPYMHAFWEDAGMGVSDPDNYPQRLIAVPTARSAFLTAFGT